MVKTILRAWLVTAVCDALFSSVLNAFFYGSTVARLWQGVASTLLGPSAMDGGMHTVAIGLAMHMLVALVWSINFYTLVSIAPVVRRFIRTTAGVLMTSALYGPAIWIVMSFGVIQLMTHRPPTITSRWWVQFFGHMVFVALPIVAMTKFGLERDGETQWGTTTVNPDPD